MDTKATNQIQLNQSELHQYSRTLARRLTDYYFIDHSFIEGKDILNFCDIKQVNLFLVKNLFEKWQGETTKLESPYFDFNHTAVKQALQQFMNILSQHIKIAREDFYPLLTESIRETLTIIVQPLSFFQHEINKLAYQPPTRQKYKEISKYILINKKIWVAFLDKIDHLQELDKTAANQALEVVFEAQHDTIEPMQWALQNFSDMLHLDINKLLGQEEESNNAPERLSEKTIIMEDNPTVINEKAPAYQPPTESPQQKKLIQEDDTDEEDQADGAMRTLNDAFKNQNQPTNLAERFRNAKVANLRAAISLNQKFQFINKLFDGDSFAFNEALDRLEKSQSYEEVRFLIHNEYGQRYAWDFSQEDTKSFMDLIERKFFG